MKSGAGRLAAVLVSTLFLTNIVFLASAVGLATSAHELSGIFLKMPSQDELGGERHGGFGLWTGVFDDEEPGLIFYPVGSNNDISASIEDEVAGTSY